MTTTVIFFKRKPKEFLLFAYPEYFLLCKLFFQYSLFRVFVKFVVNSLRLLAFVNSSFHRSTSSDLPTDPRKFANHSEPAPRQTKPDFVG